MSKLGKPRVLFCDIETLPLEAWTWGTFDQNVALNQIKSDWTVLSWSAKWQGEKEVMYMDVRSEKNVRNDKKILRGIWKLLNEADIVVWHYGSAFDHKKLNARFILNGFLPPAPYKQIDTKKLASKHFGFTSNKLEYLTENLNKKYRKSKHKKFEGFSMWRECMAGNQAAFREMEEYNKMDVLSLEELYGTLKAWGTGINQRVFDPSPVFGCPHCGSTKLQSRGFGYSNVGKYRKFQCTACGGWTSEAGQKNNLLTPRKRAALKGAEE
jgi:uncharacterized protein YprB with RNaseH-like and TPR domain